MARHLAPFSCRQTIAEMVRRRSFGCVLPLGRHASTNGSSLVQCASVSMAPPPLSRGAKRPQPHPVQARTGPNDLGAEVFLSQDCELHLVQVGNGLVLTRPLVVRVEPLTIEFSTRPTKR